MMTYTERELDTYIQSLVDNGDEIIVFDTLDNTHLQIIGRVLWHHRGDKPLFIVGSSGVEAALTRHWQQSGVIAMPNPLKPLDTVDQLVVMSGSAAPENGEQIQWALDNEFAGLHINAPRLIDPATADDERETTLQRAFTLLDSGASLVMYTAQGPDDAMIKRTRDHALSLGIEHAAIGHRLGEQQGIILRTLLEKTGIRRTVVCGGDTSGHTASQLGIYALRAVQQIAPGAPLCRASSANPALDGLEIALKGGQNGAVDYFGAIKNGHI